MTNYRFSALLLALLFAVGCGGGGGGTDPEPIPTTSVSGTVTVKGQPFKEPGFGVTFWPDGRPAGTTLPIGEGGKFSGEAPIGSCKVTIVAVGSDEGGHAASGEAGILEVYTSDATTKLTADVAEGKTFEFEVGQ